MLTDQKYFPQTAVKLTFQVHVLTWNGEWIELKNLPEASFPCKQCEPMYYVKHITCLKTRDISKLAQTKTIPSCPRHGNAARMQIAAMGREQKAASFWPSKTKLINCDLTNWFLIDVF